MTFGDQIVNVLSDLGNFAQSYLDISTHFNVVFSQVTERFRDRVVDEGYSPSYGARPLRRAIMRLLEDSMAEGMLAGQIKEGDSAIIDVDSEGSVTVLNGTTGTASNSAIEAPAGIS